MTLLAEYLDGLKIPPGWHQDVLVGDGARWVNVKRKLSVIASIDREEDGKNWLHLSIAHPRRLPTWAEVGYLKNHWAGYGRKCIMVFPEITEHVNIHRFCLHLFCCLDVDDLPDFTRGTGCI